MNSSAVSRTATAQSVSRVLTLSCSVAADTFADGRLGGCCPIARMFELVQSGLRLLFIGAASVVLALAGILLSIVAAVRRVYYQWRGIEDPSLSQANHEPKLSPLRDRVTAARSQRPPLRHRSTHGSRSSSVEARVASGSRTPLRSSPEPMLPSEERHSRPSPPRERRRRPRPQLPDLGLPSIDSALEDVEELSTPPTRPPLVVHGSGPDKDPVRALSSPTQVLSDLSSQSTEPSIAESTEERTRAERSRSPTRVFQRLKEHHNQLRERCLTRVHSMPNAKTAKPVRRTDPYQAPYYFPTPLSPDADNYIQQVRSERQGAKPTDPISFRQYFDRVPLSPRTSPKSKEPLLPPAPATPEIVVSSDEGVASTSSTPEDAPRPSLREKSHRWSWHLPHLHGKAQQDDTEPQEEAVEKPTPRFLFGHHRRRNGTASEEMKTRRISLPPTS